jgi:iron complex outermembrane receptor protein
LASTCLLSGGFLLLATGAALAQPTDTTSGSPSDTKRAKRPDIEQVVVTAQRRKQTLQEAPVAVTFISPQTTRNLDVRTIHDVSDITPSVSFSQQVDFDQVFIRGIGTNFANPGLETSVAIYEDGVYLTSTQAVLDLLDTAGVQVLNGPQGTLYGRNASGGVILVDTANPTNRQGGSIQTEFGMYGHVLTDAVYNIPVSPDLRIRVAGRFRNEDGYIHNEYDGKTLGGEGGGEGRIKIDWTPSAIPGLDITGSVDASYYKQRHDYEQELLPAPQCLTCALFGAKPPTGFYDTNQDNDGVFIQRDLLTYLRVNYVAGPITYTSLTGYHKAFFGAPQGSDQDYTTVPFFSFHSAEPGDTITEDLTMQTNYGGPLNFLAGLSYLNDRRSFDSAFFGEAFAAVDQGNAVPMNDTNVLTKSVSGFIQGTYKITDALSVQAGGRYNVDNRVLTSHNNLEAAEVFNGLGAPYSFGEKVTFYSFTPSGVLTYKIPVIGDAYVSYTKGFKAGGFSTPAFSEVPSVAPEKVQSEELGLKSRFLDGRLTTNFAGYHYTDTGLQVQITDVDAGGDITKNAGSSEGYGVELNSRFAATPDLIFGLGGDYLHAVFTNFQNAAVVCEGPGGFLEECNTDPKLGPVSPYTNLTGTVLPRSPKFTGYLTAEYSFPVWPGFHASLAGVLHYTTAFDFIAGAGGQLGLDKQAGYALMNINGWLTPDSGKYRVGFYLDNATATHYNDFETTGQPYGAYHQAAEPIAAGVKLQYNFGEF